MAQRPRQGESAADLYPNLLLDWCNDNEGTLFDYKAGSNYKAHWICHKCGAESHRTIYGATTYKCKKCSIIDRSKNKDIAGMNLLEAFPDIAKQWSKRNLLKPQEVTHCSDKRVWWVCEYGHEWEQTVANRTKNKSGCPICGNIIRGEKRRLADETNSLLDRYKDIANEIDKSKNNVDASKIKYGSHDILWWKCSRGHSYQCMVALRTLKGYGCKICSAYGTSLGEQVIFRYLKRIYNNVYNRNKSLGIELDIYVDDIRIAIEYNGKNWHKDKEYIDNLKKEICIANNITLYTIIEEANNLKCKQVNENKFTVGGSNKNKTLEILKILSIILNKYNIQLDREIAKVAIEEAYEYRHGKPEIGESLAEKRHDLMEEWDVELNDANPFDLKCGSNYRAHWKCKTCGHRWETIIYNRASLGTNCPKCNKN